VNVSSVQLGYRWIATDVFPPPTMVPAKKKEQRTENREQRTENREQRTENREQRTENREQRTENKEQRRVKTGVREHYR
jgi:hypothetical protein